MSMSESFTSTAKEVTYDELDSDDEFMADEGNDLPDGDVPNTTTQSKAKMCIVCEVRPAYSKGGKSYPTCGLKCAAILEAVRNIASTTIKSVPVGATYRGPGAIYTSTAAPGYKSTNSTTLKAQQAKPLLVRRPSAVSYAIPSRTASSSTKIVVDTAPGLVKSDTTSTTTLENCVVCLVRTCTDSKYVTCGIVCAERLCTIGSAKPDNCDYCHRFPKIPGHRQCGQTCSDNAKFACLLCKCRPKLNRYHLCGETCRTIAIKKTPMILEAPPGHDTHDMVEKKFKAAWSSPPGVTCPPIRHIYKIIEDKNFLQPYDKYKKAVGNEVFRYHGTKRQCNLGEGGKKKLCSSNGCALCSILRTSFKKSLASPSGAFGSGIYSSSASNKAYNYTNRNGGAIILTKVILGKVRNVNNWNEVMHVPPGFDSVVFDRQNGSLNETVVYTDDAIRPIFLIIF